MIRVILAASCLACSPIWVSAQQVCYSYDLRGQLIRVTDPGGDTAFYDYDSVGNIVAIRRETLARPVAIAMLIPPTAPVGALIEVSGIGFSSVLAEHQVTINGIAAEVVSANACTVTVRVPAGDTAGPVRVTTPKGTAVSAQTFVPSGLTVTGPTVRVVLTGTGIDLSSTVTGCSSADVVWSVNGMAGGSALFGTISPTGHYTAPSAAPTPGVVTIEVESLACPALVASIQVAIVDALFLPSAISVRRGALPIRPVPTPVVGAASVAYGFVGTAPVAAFMTGAVAVTRGPVILSIVPNAAKPGDSLSVSVSGAELAGATSLMFLRAGKLDVGVTASDLVPSGTGDALTATVAVSSVASAGPLTVVVATPLGRSTHTATPDNTFTITP